MNCKECNNDEFNWNEIMGELECVNCGFIIVRNIFESRQSVNLKDYDIGGNAMESTRLPDRGLLGSVFGRAAARNNFNRTLVYRLKRTARISQYDALSAGIISCNLVLSKFNPTPSMKERVESYYRTLHKKRVMSGFDLDIRAVGIVYYVMKENGIAISIQQLAKENEVSASRSSKFVKKAARHLGKPWLLHQISISSWTERICYDLKADRHFTYDARRVAEHLNYYLEQYDYTYTRTYLGASIYISSIIRQKAGMQGYTQRQIADALGIVDVSLRSSFRKILSVMGISKKQLLTMTIDEFISGIRNE